MATKKESPQKRWKALAAKRNKELDKLATESALVKYDELIKSKKHPIEAYIRAKRVYVDVLYTGKLD